MTVTQQQAKRALGMLKMFGTPDHAAHQCSIQLTALGGYTDSELTAVRSILRNVAARPYQVSALELLAEGKPIERYTDDTGEIRYRARVTMGECQECGDAYPLTETNSTVFCDACVEHLKASRS